MYTIRLNFKHKSLDIDENNFVFSVESKGLVCPTEIGKALEAANRIRNRYTEFDNVNDLKQYRDFGPAQSVQLVREGEVIANLPVDFQLVRANYHAFMAQEISG